MYDLIIDGRGRKSEAELFARARALQARGDALDRRFDALSERVANMIDKLQEEFEL